MKKTNVSDSYQRWNTGFLVQEDASYRKLQNEVGNLRIMSHCGAFAHVCTSSDIVQARYHFTRREPSNGHFTSTWNVLGYQGKGSDILVEYQPNLDFLDSFTEVANIKLNRNPSSGGPSREVRRDERTDWLTDMTKVIGSFRDVYEYAQRGDS